MATTQTEGLVGGDLREHRHRHASRRPIVPAGGTIPGREPFSMADLLQQASDTITLVNDTVEALRGDVETRGEADRADRRGCARADRGSSGRTSRPSPQNGNRISADTQRDHRQHQRAAKGTIGKLVNDDTLYHAGAARLPTRRRPSWRTCARCRPRRAARSRDFRSKDGPAQGLMADMRVTLTQAREATADLADNMEAMKHNFLLRGFFNQRGYFDLNAISPAEYRNGVLENGKRKAMRIWLASPVLFEAAPMAPRC